MKSISFCFLSLLLVSLSRAELRLASPFQDHAVLQQGIKLPVWGEASPGKTVEVSFAGQKESTTADENGRWEIALAPLAASAEGRSLKVAEEGGGSLEISDLLVGEVWLAGGQSNMEWRVSATREEDRKFVQDTPTPLLRLFHVPRKLSDKNLDYTDANWQLATAETSQTFSAVGWFFGQKIAEELQVPVGIIESAYGGSRVEPWWGDDALAEVKELQNLYQYRSRHMPGSAAFKKKLQKYVQQVKEWVEHSEIALNADREIERIPNAPQALRVGHTGEIGLYKGMIHPLVPYAVRGFIWYQGENNVGEAMVYASKKKALIESWRKQFRVAQAPFYYVQLAPYIYKGTLGKSPYNLPELWWAQQSVMAVPNTGMAVVNDIGNLNDIHPRNKSAVGHRLAGLAMANTYKNKKVVPFGPLYSGFQASDGGIEVHFSHIDGGLTTRDGKAPDYFEIAGKDGEFHPAQAEITSGGKSILLHSEKVPSPDRARFAWTQTAQPNLMNSAGLPAAAFHTHWPHDPELGTLVSRNNSHHSSHPNKSGWDGGLTDGIWGANSKTCYATDPSNEFPKSVTIDLKENYPLTKIRYGTPRVGATKTVSISLSSDGKNFKEVGRNDFPAGQAARKVISFPETSARYVRATFLGNYPKQDGYNETYGFLSEIEAYTEH